MSGTKNIPLESVITREILRYLRKQPDVWCFKAHGGAFQSAGIPDIVACVAGRFVGMEVKRPQVGRMTPLQEKTRRDILECGGLAMIVRSVDDAQQVVEWVRKGTV